MLKPEPFTPNLKAIAQSEIWREQVAPMLESMYFAALEGSLGGGAAPRMPDGSHPTLEDYHFWRGVAYALKDVCELVEGGAEMESLAAATEKKDEYQGQYDDRRLADRRSRA